MAYNWPGEELWYAREMMIQLIIRLQASVS